METMRERIIAVLKQAVGTDAELDVTVPDRAAFGHYATNIALRLSKEEQRNPLELAKELAKKIAGAAPEGFFEKVEAAPPGFVNFWLSPETIRKEFARMTAAGDAFGMGDALRGTRVMVEYTDPNPFKQFHIGHLMTNMIGEAIARLYEAAGAEVLRVNYQGDVGLHVAKSVWGMAKLAHETPTAVAAPAEKAAFLGRAYVAGVKAYDDPAIKAEIDALNKAIYDRNDPAVNERYDRGRQWSLDYFETLYARLGTKFVHYFFESESGPDGVAIVKAHPDVFVESEGAVIFRGESYGLHNRVFMNSQGLPTYEAKELGLNKKKFDLYHPDLSLIVTGNEINDYFRVLLKAMERTVPEAAEKTRHIGHGMLRLPTGKMSSRTGDVLTAEWLIDEVKRAVGERMKDAERRSEAEREAVKEKVAIAAIRYSILRQTTGKDIIFDLETSVAFHGESGPYLQYTYARLASIRRKAEGVETGDGYPLVAANELGIMRKLVEFPYVVVQAAKDLAPNAVALYLYTLADLANGYYEATPILKDEDIKRRDARLALIGAVAGVLKRGLGLLGIETPEKI